MSVVDRQHLVAELCAHLLKLNVSGASVVAARDEEEEDDEVPEEADPVDDDGEGLDVDETDCAWVTETQRAATRASSMLKKNEEENAMMCKEQSKR